MEKVNELEKINELENNKTFFQEYKSYIVGTAVFSVVAVVAGLYYFEYLDDIFNYFKGGESSESSESSESIESIESSESSEIDDSMSYETYVKNYFSNVIHESSSEYFDEYFNEYLNEGNINNSSEEDHIKYLADVAVDDATFFKNLLDDLDNQVYYSNFDADVLANDFTEGDRDNFIDAYGDPFDYQREEDPTINPVGNVNNYQQTMDINDYVNMYIGNEPTSEEELQAKIEA